MKAIMVMFDSLNLRNLSPYGCEWVKTPNFDRLAEKTIMFENHYVGSMPCMPARRELHTGRYNFLHRSWGPIEPFDESIFETMKKKGIYSHLITDHQHYWEDGGGTYHTRYSSNELIRGQEGDPWKAILETNPTESEFSSALDKNPVMHRMHVHDAINRQYLNTEEKMPQTLVFDSGIEFLEKNHKKNNWFLQIETFDPHEPFYADQKYRDLYNLKEENKESDWPPYDFIKQDESVVNKTKRNYAALLSQCDKNLGRVLDFMDNNNLWEDTMLIVNTDHGYLLGEHGWWSKTVMPMYNEIAHIPLFIYDPTLKIQGETRKSLTQSIDIPATILQYFNIDSQPYLQGQSLNSVMKGDNKLHNYIIFGEHGKHVNVTDGKYLYMRAPKDINNEPLYEYTLMPTHMRTRFSIGELHGIELEKGTFNFMQGASCMKIATKNPTNSVFNYGTKLFNLAVDPKQNYLVSNKEIELKMINALIQKMKETEAPAEQYERLGLKTGSTYTENDLKKDQEKLKEYLKPVFLTEYDWSENAKNVYRAYEKLFSPSKLKQANFERLLKKECLNNEINEKLILKVALSQVEENEVLMADYFLSMAARVE